MKGNTLRSSFLYKKKLLILRTYTILGERIIIKKALT